MSRRRFIAGSAALLLLGACSSARKIPELPAFKGRSAQVRWTVELDGGGYGFLPAVVGDGVYGADRDGSLVRVAAANGITSWRIDAGTRLVAGVGASAGLVAVAGRDGSLRMFDETGKPRWTAMLGSEASSVPAVDADVVVIRSSDNRVQAFDALSGRRRWVYSRQNPTLVLRQTAQIVLDTTTAYVGLPGGRMIGLSTETGALRFETAITMPRGSNEIERIADVLGSPALVGRQLCSGAYHGRVGCLDTSNGRPIWSNEVPIEGGIAFDGVLVVATDERGRVHAISRTGEPKWTQDAFAGRILGAPTLLGSQIVFGDEQGYVHWLASDDGRLLARSETDGSAITSAPVVAAAGLVVVQTARGRMYGLTAG